MVIQDSIVPITSQEASQKGAPIIAVNAALAGQPSLFGDGVHPTDMGYAKLAQVMLADGTTALPEASATDDGAPDAVGSSEAAAPVPESGPAEAGASEGGGGNNVESTPTGQSSGCALGTEGRGSRVPPGGCLAALALLILERRRRARLGRLRSAAEGRAGAGAFGSAGARLEAVGREPSSRTSRRRLLAPLRIPGLRGWGHRRWGRGRSAPLGRRSPHRRATRTRSLHAAGRVWGRSILGGRPQPDPCAARFTAF